MDSSPAHAVAPAVVSAAPAAEPMAGGIGTMAGVLLVFLMVAFAIVYLQYHFNRGVRMVDSDSDRWPPRGRGRSVVEGERMRGVDPELLRTLPVTVYRAGNGKGSTEGEGEAVECAVCLAELEDGEEARFLPRCGHGFHAECIDMWLASHSTCPLCRLTVGKPEVVSPAAPVPILPPLPPEPANYAANLPASVLLEVSSQGAITAVTVSTSDGGPRPSAPVLVIEIPESTPVQLTPRDPAKSPGPGSARMRTVRRLWSFGRQGPSGSTPSWACGRSGGEGADIEQGIVSVAAVGVRAMEAPPVAASSATPRAAVQHHS